MTLESGGSILGNCASMTDHELGKEGKTGHVNPGYSSHSKIQIPTPQPHISEDNDDSDEDVDRSFGLGCMKSPKLGKYLSNLYYFAFLLGNAALMSAAAVRSISINLQSLKTQFNLGDDEAANLQVVNSAGIAASSLFAGYIGSFHKANIPVLVGTAGFLNGIALMAPSFLQFANPYHMNINPANANDIFTPFLCTSQPTNTSGPQQQQPPPVDMTAFGVLLFSQAMSGILLPLITVLAPVYMDNNEVNKSKLGIFMGIYTLFVESASVAGLSISGFLATNPVDFKETPLNTQDRRFVGAWWLPLLILGGVLCMTSLQILQFPKQLISRKSQKKALAKAALSFAAVNFGNTARPSEPSKSSAEKKGKTNNVPKLVSLYDSKIPASDSDTANHTARDDTSTVDHGNRRPSIADSIVYDDSAAVSRDGLVHGIKDFPMQVYRIMKNPIFSLIMIDAALLAIPLKGSELFRPTYQIFEFSLSTETVSAASMAYSVANILGVLAGAAICWKIRTLKGYALAIFLCFGLCSIIAPLYFALGCENQVLFGYEGKYGVSLPNMTTECQCKQDYPLPTCGDDGSSYYSPCFAGCHAGDGFNFQNCTSQSTPNDRNAKSMMCDAGCLNSFIGYTAVLLVLTFLTQTAVVPRSLLIIRVVEPRDRAFGTSVFIFFFALFSIPASKLFGHVFEDVGCLISTGDVCVLYDRTKIRYLMSGVEMIVYIVLFFTTWIMFLIFKMMARKVILSREELQPAETGETTNSEKL